MEQIPEIDPGDPQASCNVFQQKYSQLGLKGTEKGQNERRLLGTNPPIPQILQARNKLIKLLDCKHVLFFLK